MVHVHASTGDLGNEIADYEAGLGTKAEEVVWERETHPMAMASIMSPAFPLLHKASWAKNVEKL